MNHRPFKFWHRVTAGAVFIVFAAAQVESGWAWTRATEAGAAKLAPKSSMQGKSREVLREAFGLRAASVQIPRSFVEAKEQAYQAAGVSKKPLFIGALGLLAAALYFLSPPSFSWLAPFCGVLVWAVFSGPRLVSYVRSEVQRPGWRDRIRRGELDPFWRLLGYLPAQIPFELLGSAEQTAGFKKAPPAAAAFGGAGDSYPDILKRTLFSGRAKGIYAVGMGLLLLWTVVAGIGHGEITFVSFSATALSFCVAVAMASAPLYQILDDTGKISRKRVPPAQEPWRVRVGLPGVTVLPGAVPVPVVEKPLGEIPFGA